MTKFTDHLWSDLVRTSRQLGTSCLSFCLLFVILQTVDIKPTYPFGIFQLSLRVELTDPMEIVSTEDNSNDRDAEAGCRHTPLLESQYRGANKPYMTAV